ncbi:MAG: hypothetical protein IJL24_05010 [Treponema sp.]|nr:hypothetical protein [Treponema sp.]
MTLYFLYRNSGRCWTVAENQKSCEEGMENSQNKLVAKAREARYNPIIGGAKMTVVVNNASEMFVQALKAMAKIDGASVYLDDSGYYSKKTVKSVLKADKQMQKDRAKGKLKLYDSVDELFGDL